MGKSSLWITSYLGQCGRRVHLCFLVVEGWFFEEVGDDVDGAFGRTEVGLVPVCRGFGHLVEALGVFEEVGDDHGESLVMGNGEGGSVSQELCTDQAEIAVVGAEEGGNSVSSGFDRGLAAFVGGEGLANEGDGGELGEDAEFSCSVGYVYVDRAFRGGVGGADVPTEGSLLEQVADFFTSFGVSRDDEQP